MRRRFGAEYTLAGLAPLLHRIGWSEQVPSRKAAERNEAKIAAWLCFEDEAGQGLRPPKGRTWATGATHRSCGSPPRAPNASPWRR
ncbi:winged helix-turn-helix domain-containing protein [Streptomyces sp. NPDC090798]|uniref:helix-turn-helix domain-containing protein n=1 Tax=Streptomyces sp. NPDC090798 TaxID=3365968 RepID=UPI0037F47EB9